MNPPGVIIRESPYSVKDMIDRVQEFLLQHGATIYARIDQQAEVQKAGQELNSMEFILFGNPKAGGLLMIQNPLIALDLPLKVIAWEDMQGKVWIAYNEASYIQNRYALPLTENSPLNIDAVMAKIINAEK